MFISSPLFSGTPSPLPHSPKGRKRSRSPKSPETSDSTALTTTKKSKTDKSSSRSKSRTPSPNRAAELIKKAFGIKPNSKDIIIESSSEGLSATEQKRLNALSNTTAQKELWLLESHKTPQIAEDKFKDDRTMFQESQDPPKVKFTTKSPNHFIFECPDSSNEQKRFRMESIQPNESRFTLSRNTSIPVGQEFLDNQKPITDFFKPKAKE